MATNLPRGVLTSAVGKSMTSRVLSPKISLKANSFKSAIFSIAASMCSNSSSETSYKSFFLFSSFIRTLVSLKGTFSVRELSFKNFRQELLKFFIVCPSTSKFQPQKALHNTKKTNIRRKP